MTAGGWAGLLVSEPFIQPACAQCLRLSERFFHLALWHFLAFLDKFGLKGFNVNFWLCLDFFQQEGRSDITYTSSFFKLQSFDDG